MGRKRLPECHLDEIQHCTAGGLRRACAGRPARQRRLAAVLAHLRWPSTTPKLQASIMWSKSSRFFLNPPGHAAHSVQVIAELPNCSRYMRRLMR